MPTIPDSLRSLFTARVRDQAGRYVVEVPASEIEHGGLQAGNVYRVAVLEGPPDGTDSEAVSHASARDEPAERRSPDPPVEEGERRTVTVEAVGDQGDGIAKVDRGYVVIVPEGQPGDEPTVEIEQVQPNVAFARIVDSDARTL